MANLPCDEEALFHAARRLRSPAERAEYLRSACGDDAALLGRVQALLSVHDEEHSLGGVRLGPTADAIEAMPRPGSAVGRYRLLEQIGEGGFGTVFMAEQQHPVRRRVALKVIKPGMDTRQVIARFEAERQALALMDHPNIARVLDAGATDTGRPYFVMELVKGVPITDYCDKNNLTPRQRLELFVQVCHAVQHAHQKGVIHRDLKPGNVLVTLHDGQPVPKVIDFGIAKATGQQLTEKTLFTNFAQMVGTPLYMSPEQAELSGLDVDTRSDVYSLGVLLYELLTGTTPFDKGRLGKAAYEEIRRIIREEEPPKPSSRISTLGQTLSAVSSRRATEPKKLGPLVRGELDCIVMKALEKDRARRYETANALAVDVRHYLENEPVSARPASAAYRLRKFASKHKVGFGAASAVAAALVLGVAGTTLMMIHATNERDRAVKLSGELDQQRREALDAKTRAEAAKAQAERDRAVIEVSEAATRQNLSHTRNLFSFLWDVVGGAGHDRDMTVQELLDRTVTRIDRRQVPYHPRPESAIRHALGTAYQDLGRLAEAEAQLRQAVRLREGWAGVDHRDVAQRAVAVSVMALGAVLSEQGRPDDALPMLERALDLFRTEGVSRRETLTTLIDLQRVSAAKGRHSEAGQYAREAAELRTKLGLDDSPPELAGILDQAYARLYRNDFGAAERLLRDGIDLHRRVKGGQDDHTLIVLHHHLGRALVELGRNGDAEIAYRDALAVSERLLGTNSPEAAATLGNLSRVLRAQHKEEEGRAAEIRYLAAQTHVVGDAIRTNPAKASLYYERGNLLCRAGRFRDALPDFDKAIELDPGDHEKYAFSAPVYLFVDDVEGYRRVSRQLAQRFGTSDSLQVGERVAKASLIGPDPEGDLELFARLLERAVAHGESHPSIDWFKTALGLLEYRRGRYEQAVKAVEGLPLQGRMVYDQPIYGFRSVPYGRGIAGLVLAMAHAGAGRTDQARRALAEVEARFDALSATPGASDLNTFDDWCTYQIILGQARSVVNGPAEQGRR